MWWIISSTDEMKTINFNKAEGSYVSKFTNTKIILHGFDIKLN